MKNFALQRADFRTDSGKPPKDAIQEAFSLLDAAHAVVEKGMHARFYDSNGQLKCSEREVYEWVADRAIDEYKIGYQAGYLLHRYGHVMQPWLAQSLGKQVYDEMRHYRLLHHILPAELQDGVEYRMASFPELLSKNVRWKSLVVDISRDSYVDALLEVTLVHEGFANAAIKPAVSLPFHRVAKAYSSIARDEQTHFSIGRRYVVRECNDTDSAAKVLKVAIEARARADGCCQYGW